MQGVERAEVRDAITRAFSSEQFDMFLYETMNFDREAEIADGPFRVIVNNVLRRAEEEGWDAALIAEVAKARPLKPDVQAVYQKYARHLIDEARRRQVDEKLLGALERYGLAPKEIEIQRAGATESVEPGKDSGLQKAIKKLIPDLDAGLWSDQFFRLQSRVGRVELEFGPGQFDMGTAFLVGPDVLLTNYHVLRRAIENQSLAPNVRIRFDYRVLANGHESEGVLVPLRGDDWLIDYTKYSVGEGLNQPDSTLPTVDELDFALVRLDRKIGDEPISPDSSNGPPRGWIVVPQAPQPIVLKMALMILHHPLKRPLKLAPDTEAVLSVNSNGTRVRYTNNTEPGSSGSPVFDINWNLVALHHYGDPAFNHPPKYNQGIPIGTIRDRLKRKNLEAALAGPAPV